MLEKRAPGIHLTYCPNAVRAGVRSCAPTDEPASSKPVGNSASRGSEPDAKPARCLWKLTARSSTIIFRETCSARNDAALASPRRTWLKCIRRHACAPPRRSYDSKPTSPLISRSTMKTASPGTCHSTMARERPSGSVSRRSHGSSWRRHLAHHSMCSRTCSWTSRTKASSRPRSTAQSNTLPSRCLSARSKLPRGGCSHWNTQPRHRHA